MKKIRIIAILAALLTCVLVYSLLNSAGKSSAAKPAEPKEETMTTILTAAKDIPDQTKITDDMVATKQIPANLVITGTVLKKSDVVGKYSNTKIIAHEPLLKGKFTSQESELAYSLKKGMRAATFTVDSETGVGGLIKIGNHVDVVMAFSDQNKNIKATTLLQNIEVVAVDNKTGSGSGGSASSGSGSSSSASSDSDSSSVTLSVKPADAEKLTLAVAACGRMKGNQLIRLVLRPQADNGTSSVGVVTLQDITK